MRLPAESSSSWSHLGFAVFVWASLKAWSEAEDVSADDRAFFGELATVLRSKIDDLLREARETQDAAYFARPLAMAQRNVRLFQLKRRLQTALNRVIDVLALGSKDHAIVRQFLPKLMATVTGAAIGRRPQLAIDAASRLAKGAGELPDRAELAERITSMATQAAAAIKAAEDALNGWVTERSEEVVAKGQLRLELERTHRGLGARFPGNRAFVESFFLVKGTKPSEGTEEDEEPTEEPTPQPETNG